MTEPPDRARRTTVRGEFPSETKFAIRPGTTIYAVNPREYILEWGVTPRLSVLLRDDTENYAGRALVTELRDRGGIEVDDWRRRLGDDAFRALVQPLVTRDLLVPAALVLSVRDGLPADTGLAVGVVGGGAPFYMAIETLARHRDFLHEVHLCGFDSDLETNIGALFPYCGPKVHTVADFVEQIGLTRKVTTSSDLRRLSAVDVIVVALPRFDFSLLTKVEQVARTRGTPWAHSLSSCALGLAGPIGGAETQVRVVDLIQNLQHSGFLREAGGPVWAVPSREDELVGTSVSVLCQTVPKAVVEGLRFARTGRSSLRAAMHVVDADRGLVSRSRILISAPEAADAPIAEDPPVAPPLIARPKVSGEADS